jgi:hypothetical protein
VLRYALSALIIFAFAQKSPYDLALQGGRVMDPQSGLDAVRNSIRAGPEHSPAYSRATFASHKGSL